MKISNLKRGNLRITAPSEKAKKNRLRIRFHTSVIILLMKKAIDELGVLEEVNIEICNDIDGHFHEIKDMIFKHFIREIPALKPEDIVATKFSKPSKIDEAGKAFRENDSEKIKKYHTLKLDSKELFELIKK